MVSTAIVVAIADGLVLSWCPAAEALENDNVARMHGSYRKVG